METFLSWISRMTNSRLSLFLLMPTKYFSRETKLSLKIFFKIATSKKLICFTWQSDNTRGGGAEGGGNGVGEGGGAGAGGGAKSGRLNGGTSSKGGIKAGGIAGSRGTWSKGGMGGNPGSVSVPQPHVGQPGAFIRFLKTLKFTEQVQKRHGGSLSLHWQT